MPQEPIDIVVSEKGVTAAAASVSQLADNADRAESSVGKLRAALAEIKGASVQALKAAMLDAKGGTDELQASVRASSASQKEAAGASETVTKALTTEAAATRALKAEKLLLQTAEKAAARDRQLYAQEMLAQARSEAIAQDMIAKAAEEELAAERLLAAQMDTMFAARDREIAQQLELAQARELALAVHDAGIENNRIDAEIAANEKLILAQKAESEELAALELQYAALSEYRGANISEMAAETGEIDLTAASYRQLSEATVQLNATKQLQRDISKAVTDGYLTEEEASFANVAVLRQQTEATEQVQLAKSNLAETIAYLNAGVEVEVNTQRSAITVETERKATIQGLAGALGLYTAEQKAASLATGAGVSENVAAAASLGLLEGRTLSVNRAAAQFLTKIVGIGPALTTAFAYVIGPIVLISVLVMIGTEIDKILTKAKELPNTITESFRKSTDEVRTSVLSLTTEADKLQYQLDKIEGKPQQNGGVIALDEMAEAADRLSVQLDKDITKLDELTKKNSVGFWDKILGAKGTDDVDKIAAGLQAKLREIRDDYDNTIQSGLQRGDLSKDNLARLREQELGALVGAYGDATKKLDPLVTKLRSQLADYNDPAMRAFGVGGKDPSADLAKAQGIQKQMLADQQQIGEGYRKDNLGAEVQAAKAGVAAQGDLAKEAKVQWQGVLAEFVKYQQALRDANHGENATTADKLQFFQQEQPKLLPLNKDKGNAEINKYQTDLAKEQFPANELAKLKEQADAMNQYGDSLRETTMLNKILDQARRDGINISDEMVAAYQKYIKIIVEGRPDQAAYNSVFKEATKAVNEHTLIQNAGIEVAKDYPQYSEKIAQAMRRESEAYKDSIDPLRKYHDAQLDQLATVGKYGQELKIEQDLQALQNRMIANGTELSQADILIERQRLTVLADTNLLEQAKSRIFYDQADALHKLVIEQQALNDLHKDGKLNDDQYKIASVQNQAAQNENANANNQGKGKPSDFLTNTLASYVTIKSVAQGLQATLKATFASLADGVANALGRAIVMGENLGKALKDVAREALAGLLSALIKIAIQMAIVEILFKVFKIPKDGGDTTKQTLKNTATSIAGITLVTAAMLTSIDLLTDPAWSLAEAVSLASFGANAIAANAGIASVVAAGTSAQHFADGGYVSGNGGPRSDTVPAWLSPGEYVLNARTTQQLGGRAVLDNVQRGVQSVASNTPSLGKTSTSTKAGYSVVIEDHTGGVKWQTVTVGEDQMRIIAQDESKQAVATQTDGIVANHLGNGNSKTSKALKQNTTARRTG
jgi:hypothetical protein